MPRSSLAASIVALAVLVLGTSAARADRTRVLVLPLPAGSSVDADVARAFDARILVALEDTGAVTTLTPSEEPDCTTLACLAELATAARADSVLSMSVLRESEGLTLFATLVDAGSAAAARRTELTGLSAGDVAKTAPTKIAREITAGARSAATTGKGGVVGVMRPSGSTGRAAAVAIADQLAAMRTFTVVALGAKGDRANLTHKAEVSITDFSIVKRRHHVHRYLDGVLVGTLTITDLADGTVVFTNTVNVTVSRRARYSSTAEVTALLVESAVNDWISAFHGAGVEAHLKGGT
jgi:hypothetical protein